MSNFFSYRQQLRERALVRRQDRFHLHPYQEEAVEQAWAAWQAGHHNVLVSLPTGTGKTEVAFALMRRVLEQEPGGRALFLTHRRELATQTADRLRLRQPQWANDIGLVMGGECEANKRIIVATVQSLAGQRSRWLALLRHAGAQSAGPFVFLTIDECHHAVAQGYLDVARALQNAVPILYHLGLTATPARNDRHNLSEVYYPAYSRSIRWAVENGYLVAPEGIRVGTDVDLSRVRCKDGDFVDAALGQVLNTPAFNDMLVKLYQEFLPDMRTLVFCATVKHAEAVHAEFQQADIPASVVVGTTPDDKRRNIIAAFVRGEARVVVNVGVFTEGVDIPCAEGLIMARPTQSSVLYTQIVGRVLRLSPGKVKATIVDVTGTGQTLFTLDDLMEFAPGTTPYHRAVKANVSGFDRRQADLGEDTTSITVQSPLHYWTEVMDLLGRSPTAWYSVRGRSVSILSEQQYALLMPPGGAALAAVIKQRLGKESPANTERTARLEWQREHADDFCLFFVHDGKCEPVDWDRDYNTLLSVASTWMEDKADKTLAARERSWRFAPASDRQVESLARWGIVPSVEWLRAREREVGLRLLGGTASNLLSYKIALSTYTASGFALPSVTEQNDESAESRFRRLLRGQKAYREAQVSRTSNPSKPYMQKGQENV